ncbi:MAG: hypothetical protein DRJ47_00595 [Thermoprotei archaeon]|nr:MAG: hypothetical protein DRJ47_00595 [Thermoprotei archaeon]
MLDEAIFALTSVIFLILIVSLGYTVYYSALSYSTLTLSKELEELKKVIHLANTTKVALIGPGGVVYEDH